MQLNLNLIIIIMKKFILGLVLAFISTFSLAQTSTAYIAPGELRTFLDYNLGADNVSDPLVPSQGLHGAKYKWGNITPLYTAAQDQANAGYINPWEWSIQPSGAWSDTSKGYNDPCPDGYRVPTIEEWKGVIANNVQAFVGPYISGPGMSANYASGLTIGSNMFLPAAGKRYWDNGYLVERGMYGYYASTTETIWAGQDPYRFALLMMFHKGSNKGYINTGEEKRSAISVRCIKEQLPPLFDNVLGTKDSKKVLSNTKIYPNPTKNEFYIQGKGEARVEVYDITGKLLGQTVVKSSRDAIPTQALKAGTYVIKITREGKSITEKLRIQ